MSRLYEIILTQEYYSQLVVNRFTYMTDLDPVTEKGAALLNLAAGYKPSGGFLGDDTLYAYIANMQCNAVKFVNVVVQELYDPADFVTAPFLPASQTGIHTGIGLSPTMAVGFSTNRVRRDIRRGQKRFVGVYEEQTLAGGTFVQTFIDGAFSLMAGRLGEILTASDGGITISFTPVVLGVEKYTTPSGKPAYRKYPTREEQMTHVASGLVWTLKTEVRTQTSRQYRKGQ